MRSDGRAGEARDAHVQIRYEVMRWGVGAFENWDMDSHEHRWARSTQASFAHDEALEERSARRKPKTTIVLSSSPEALLIVQYGLKMDEDAEHGTPTTAPAFLDAQI